MEQIGTVKRLPAPDNGAISISRHGVSLQLYSGTHVDHHTRQLRSYVAIDYGWPFCRRLPLERLVGLTIERLRSCGFDPVEVETYAPANPDEPKKMYR